MIVVCWKLIKPLRKHDPNASSPCDPRSTNNINQDTHIDKQIYHDNQMQKQLQK